jgi:hypothetical protein
MSKILSILKDNPQLYSSIEMRVSLTEEQKQRLLLKKEKKLNEIISYIYELNNDIYMSIASGCLGQYQSNGRSHDRTMVLKNKYFKEKGVNFIFTYDKRTDDLLGSHTKFKKQITDYINHYCNENNLPIFKCINKISKEYRKSLPY